MSLKISSSSAEVNMFLNGVAFGANAPVIIPQVIDQNTVLLLHCDGINGSTVFPDSALAGGAPHSILPSGSTQVSTAQSKFGSASALFNGTTDYMSIADSPSWTLGSNDFTIEIQVRFNTLANNQYFITQRTSDGSNRAWGLARQNPNKLVFNYSTSAGISWTDEHIVNWSPATGVWYHIAACRDGANLRIFVDGVQIGVTYNASTDTIIDVTEMVSIGRNAHSGGSEYFDGYMDEIRVSNGKAWYTTNFTPPSAPFTPYI